MKIQRQCHALADELTDKVRNFMALRVAEYHRIRPDIVIAKMPDSEIHTDDQNNTVLIGGSLSGDRSQTKMCIVGEGVDVEIGEGSTVIGCIFSRLDLISVVDEGVKELNARHKIVIGKNCILIGCLIRDDVTIGDNAVMASSAVSQATIGKDARLFMSSVLLRYGSVGERLTAVQTLFHTDKCEVGADAFMMSGKWGIISRDSAIQELDKELTDRCCWLARRNVTLETLSDCFHCGVDYYEEQQELHRKLEEDPDNWEYKYARPPIYRRQYLHLDRLAKQLTLTKSIVCFYQKDATVEASTFQPLTVIFRDLITETDAEREVRGFDYDGHKLTFQEAFSYSPRIHIGNNLQVYASFPVCITRIDQDTHYWQRKEFPDGYGNFVWDKLNGHEYDLVIGDDCIITSASDWLEGKPLYKYDRIGRLIMQDGVTFYVPQEEYGDPVFVDALQTVDVFGDRSTSNRMSPRTEYIFEDNSKIFLRGTLVSANNEASHIWRVKINKNDLAII